MTENNDSNVVNWLSLHSLIQIMLQLFQAKLVATFSAVDKPIIKEQSNSAAPTAQTVHNYQKEVYPGIIGDMHGGTFHYHPPGN